MNRVMYWNTVIGYSYRTTEGKEFSADNNSKPQNIPSVHVEWHWVESEALQSSSVPPRTSWGQTQSPQPAVCLPPWSLKTSKTYSFTTSTKVSMLHTSTPELLLNHFPVSNCTLVRTDEKTTTPQADHQSFKISIAKWTFVYPGHKLACNISVS